jgi:solute carrier family 25 uncoupling protein 8/9
VLRNSIMNAAEMASYDQIKTYITKTYKSVNPESKFLHIGCGFSAGFIAVCMASPMDVVKTRMMNVIIMS